MPLSQKVLFWLRWGVRYGTFYKVCKEPAEYVHKTHTTDVLGEQVFVPNEANFRPENRIRDFTDGTQYRKQHKEKLQQLQRGSPDDLLITLILNTDGLNIQSNPRASAWPVFGTIAEICPSRGFQSEKILNIALWSGLGHPPIDCIFKYLQQEIDEINLGVS